VSPFAIPALSGSMAAASVSMRYGLTGPVMTQVAACASGVIAFQDALRLIRAGECDVILAGGSEAPLLPMAFAALGNMGALSKRNDDPEHASRPFDATRDGFLFGEGAAVCVVESAAHAMDRRRLPHQRPRANRPRRRDGDDAGDGRCGAGTDRDRLHRRPRHLDTAQ
jgi:3-oxoacyl-[acyl-carrier-protein] synthase II